jgi:hypothetical protein
MENIGYSAKGMKVQIIYKTSVLYEEEETRNSLT